MLLHFKKSNEILETWSPHCKNLAFQDPPSLNFHNGTDTITYITSLRLDCEKSSLVNSRQYLTFGTSLQNLSKILLVAKIIFVPQLLQLLEVPRLCLSKPCLILPTESGQLPIHLCIRNWYMHFLMTFQQMQCYLKGLIKISQFYWFTGFMCSLYLFYPFKK